jgi:L-aspartate oxidase
VSHFLIAQAKQHPNIELLEHHNAVDLITTQKLGLSEQRVVGAYVLDTLNNQIKTIAANTVAIATGGASKVYLYTTNPQISTGLGCCFA